MYLNRLSDLLFVAARRANRTASAAFIVDLVLSIGIVLFPVVARAHREGDRATVAEYVRQGMRLALIVSGLIVSVTSALPGPLLTLVFGADAALLVMHSPRDRIVGIANAADIYQKLLHEGVIVRPMGAFGAPDALRITVGTPTSRPGDYIELRAEMDMICGLTACSADGSNNGSFKPIDYEILPPHAPR